VSCPWAIMVAKRSQPTQSAALFLI
jgi:hypothetical protein